MVWNWRWAESVSWQKRYQIKLEKCRLSGNNLGKKKKRLSAMAAKDTLRMDRSYKRCGH